MDSDGSVSDCPVEVLCFSQVLSVYFMTFAFVFYMKEIVGSFSSRDGQRETKLGAKKCFIKANKTGSDKVSRAGEDAGRTGGKGEDLLI